MSTYNIYVTTSDIPNAGTDANVYIVLIGEAFGYPRQSGAYFFSNLKRKILTLEIENRKNSTKII